MENSVRAAVEVSNVELRLSRAVTVDLAESRALALRLVGKDSGLSDDDVAESAINALASDLLPEWYEDWALIEVEVWRQLRLHALEALAERFILAQRFASAARAALTAARCDPLRESPHAMLIRVHLCEGNQSEALREYTRYRDQLRAELGIRPSAALDGIIKTVELVGREAVTAP
jgi:DNA-binding SARP family transcriptional activator